jgi:hypothetical protein
MHVLIPLLLLALFHQQPTPQPFPRPSAPPARPATPPAPGPTTPAALPPVDIPSVPAPPVPREAELGVPVYPTAQFITSYDAGMGQRFHLFGAPAPFADVVQYYRNILKSRGELLFEAPVATHQFEIGRYRDETMAFPPSVTVKDYAAEGRGYPNPAGEPPTFATIIQIVPIPPVPVPVREPAREPVREPVREPGE